MKNLESHEGVPRLLQKVVAYAAALGELKYRHTLIGEEIAQIEFTIKSGRSAMSKKRKAERTTESAVVAVHREYRRSIQKHSRNLSRTRFLLQVEFESIGRLKAEIQMILGETIDLLKKTVYIREKTLTESLRSASGQAPV